MTTTRLAACSCGQLTAEVRGDPVRISICHCLACQRRTVGAFADPTFPTPWVSVYESRKHGWVVPPPDAEHYP